MISKRAVIDLYRKRAGRYNLTANLYYLVGFRFNGYRQRAVEALGPNPGDTVVEIACGTGLNLPLLREAVGPEGRVIGVDITDRMLDQARKRVEDAGWKNVELVQSDASEYLFPQDLNGVLSTFAITLVPEYDNIIARASRALSPGGRFCILDFKKPEDRPAWMTRFLVWATKPFGVSLDLAERHPWESLEGHFKTVTMEELYLGYTYIAVGLK